MRKNKIKDLFRKKSFSLFDKRMSETFQRQKNLPLHFLSPTVPWPGRSSGVNARATIFLKIDVRYSAFFKINYVTVFYVSRKFSANIPRFVFLGMEIYVQSGNHLTEHVACMYVCMYICTYVAKRLVIQKRLFSKRHVT
jgi:hypothetical protein